MVNDKQPMFVKARRQDTWCPGNTLEIEIGQLTMEKTTKKLSWNQTVGLVESLLPLIPTTAEQHEFTNMEKRQSKIERAQGLCFIK